MFSLTEVCQSEAAGRSDAVVHAETWVIDVSSQTILNSSLKLPGCPG